MLRIDYFPSRPSCKNKYSMKCLSDLKNTAAVQTYKSKQYFYFFEKFLGKSYK